MKVDDKKLNDAWVSLSVDIRWLNRIQYDSIRQLWILKTYLRSLNPNRKPPRSMTNQALMAELQSSRDDSIARYFRNRGEDPSLHDPRKITGFVLRLHPRITPATVRRYRRRLMSGNRSGSLSDFRRILSERFRFKVSRATLNRWFAGHQPPLKKEEELTRVFAQARNRWRIDTAAILKRLTEGSK